MVTQFILTVERKYEPDTPGVNLEYFKGTLIEVCGTLYNEGRPNKEWRKMAEKMGGQFNISERKWLFVYTEDKWNDIKTNLYRIFECDLYRQMEGFDIAGDKESWNLVSITGLILSDGMQYVDKEYQIGESIVKKDPTYEENLTEFIVSGRTETVVGLDNLKYRRVPFTERFKTVYAAVPVGGEFNYPNELNIIFIRASKRDVDRSHSDDLQ